MELIPLGRKAISLKCILHRCCRNSPSHSEDTNSAEHIRSITLDTKSFFFFRERELKNHCKKNKQQQDSVIKITLSLQSPVQSEQQLQCLRANKIFRLLKWVFYFSLSRFSSYSLQQPECILQSFHSFVIQHLFWQHNNGLAIDFKTTVLCNLGGLRESDSTVRGSWLEQVLQEIIMLL